MYLPNKYTKWYWNIIYKAKSRNGHLEYSEKHHIIPKSLGGNNSKENLVDLTAREHFICHWLLTKMVSDKELIKMKRALWRMLVSGNEFQLRYKPNSRVFEMLRHKFGSLRKGHITPLSVKEKISAANKGKVAWNKGIPRTTEEKKRISESRLGQKTWNVGISHSLETRSKISFRAKNRKKIMCSHCGLSCTPSNYKRWHGDNCKLAIRQGGY